MEKIDFYVLASTAPQAREYTACRLAAKAYYANRKLYLNTESPAQSQTLDELLWTFREQSFIPHTLVGDDTAPILIGHGPQPPANDYTVLLNLDTQVPPFIERFTRVLEIVGADAQRRAQSRQRFRFYRDRGYPLKTHQL